MRNTLPILALGTVLTAASAGTVLAQGTSTPPSATPGDRAVVTPGDRAVVTPGDRAADRVVAPGDRPYTPNNPPPMPEQKTDWGWVGLLGLLGLAGLIPKRREVTTTTTHVAGSDTVRR